jgi:hypothetical protein
MPVIDLSTLIALVGTLDDSPDPQSAVVRLRTYLQDHVQSVSDVRASTDGVDLDEYERKRRPLNIEYVQQQTIANKKRLEERAPAVREKRSDERRRMADAPQKPKAF